MGVKPEHKRNSRGEHRADGASCDASCGVSCGGRHVPRGVAHRRWHKYVKAGMVRCAERPKALVGAVLPGYSHIRQGRRCQDSMGYRLLEVGSVLRPDRHSHGSCTFLGSAEGAESVITHGVVVTAVSDGHGSQASPYSHIGSRLAVEAFCAVMGECWRSSGGSCESMRRLLGQNSSQIARVVHGRWRRAVLKAHRCLNPRTGKRLARPLASSCGVGARWDVQLRSERLRLPGLERARAKYGLEALYTLYGCTLLGTVVCDRFTFVLQIGDGDVTFASSGVTHRLDGGQKYLGVQTNSLCQKSACHKAWLHVYDRDLRADKPRVPSCHILSSDGWSNSYPDDAAFLATCGSYFEALKEHGCRAVSKNLRQWLAETSRDGCGDDITVLLITDGIKD